MAGHLSEAGIVRLNPDGSVDGAFDVGDGFDVRPLAITPADDGTGDLWVGGGFTSYRLAAVRPIVRLGSDWNLSSVCMVLFT